MKRISRLLAALLAAALLAGCGANSGGSASATATYDMNLSQEAAVAEGGGESSLMPEGAATDETAQQKIIYRADMSLESTDFDAARESLMAAVEETGSWLEYSHLSGTADDRDRYANYTVRVPADRYRDFLSLAGQAGSMLNLSENAENVTSTYIDMEARISTLENQRDRLNELAAQAETTADLLEIESQLSDVQYQLESYTQQLRALDGQITYSTVDITLREVATLTPTGTTFGERLVDAFSGGWSGFVLFVQGLVLTLVYLWPLLVVAAVVVMLIRVLARRHRAAHPKAPKGPRPTPPAPPASYGQFQNTTTPSDTEDEPKPKY